MNPTLTITPDQMLLHLKQSCRIPTLTTEILKRQVIEQTAIALGLTPTPDEIQTAADQLRLAYQLQRREDTYHWLHQHGLTLDDFENLVAYNVLSGKVLTHLFAEQIEPYFVAHQLDYRLAVLYEVVIEDEDLAWELFYALQSQELSFFELAQHHERDLEHRRRGGYRGAVARHQMPPNIAAAVFAAQPPQVLKPITTAQGIHLLRVDDLRQPPLDAPLRAEILNALFEDWFGQQIEGCCVTNLLTPPQAFPLY